MGNYLHKYLIRAALVVTCAIILIIITVSWSANAFVNASKKEIEQQLENFFDKKVNIENISYLLPHSILIENLVIFNNYPTENTSFARVKEIKIGFSLFEFINKREFSITNIHLKQTKANYHLISCFVQENMGKIITFIKSLSKDQNINLTVKNTILDLAQEDKNNTCLYIDSTLKINNNSLTGFGLAKLEKNNSTADKNKIEPARKALSYNLKGSFTEEGFLVDNLELKTDKFNSKLWGSIQGNALRLNGFLLSNTLINNGPSRKPGLNILEKLKKLIFNRSSKHIVGVSTADLNVFNIDCLVAFILPKIEIKHVDFTLNGVPISLKGSITLLNPASIELTLSSYPGQHHLTRARNPKRFDLKTTGTLKDYKFNGKITLDFFRMTKHKKMLQKTKTFVKNLFFTINSQGILTMRCQEANLTYASGTNLHKASFYDFNACFKMKNKQTISAVFDSKIYDGFLKGTGIIDTAKTPFKNSFSLTIRDVSAQKLNSMLVYFPSIHGRSLSAMTYQNFPQSELKGKLVIKDGLLDNLKLFKWLADFFNMPALKKIYFNTLSADFLVNDELAHLDKISLDSNEVSLKGYFTLYDDNLTSGKFSLGLSRNLLKTSPKFRSLLNHIDKNVPSLNINFQLSGLFDAVNFKWLNSDFKQEIRRLIPDFIERGIERKVENAVEDIFK